MALFDQEDEEGITHVLRCLEAYQKTYGKNEIIYHQNEPMPYAGIVLEGEVYTVMFNSVGNEHHVAQFLPGDLFGAAYACAPDIHSNVQTIACKNSRILFLKFSNLFLPDSIRCPYASQITSNLLRETARNNILQNQKIQLLTQKHIRERILLFLQSFPRDDSRIEIPFNRQAMANYLDIERSALSRELSRMKQEGIIDFQGNQFWL